MGQESTYTLVGRLLAAFQAGGTEAIARFYSPDYVNRTPFPGAPTTLAGHAAYQDCIARHLEIVTMAPEQIVAGDNSAAVLTRMRFRVRGTGQEFDAFGFAVVRIENGLIVENWGGYDPVAVFRMRQAGVELPDLP